MRAAEVKEPAPGAAVWGEDDEAKRISIMAIFAITVLLMGAGAFAMVRKRSG